MLILVNNCPLQSLICVANCHHLLTGTLLVCFLFKCSHCHLRTALQCHQSWCHANSSIITGCFLAFPPVTWSCCSHCLLHHIAVWLMLTSDCHCQLIAGSTFPPMSCAAIVVSARSVAPSCWCRFHCCFLPGIISSIDCSLSVTMIDMTADSICIII